jgi:outer membrane protein assembly factor BamB
MTLGTARAAEPGMIRFLPENGNNVFNEKGLLRQWPAGGPKELWRIQAGIGKCAIIEAAGRAYTLSEIDGKQWALCLDPQTGKEIWRHLLLDRSTWHEAPGPVTTPVIDGDRIYCIPYDNLRKIVREPRCPVICLRTRDGSEVWANRDGDWAAEGSMPLIKGDKLYYGAYGRDHVMIALDKMTGKVLWRVGDPAIKGKLQTYGAGASLTWQVVDGIPTVVMGVFQQDQIGVHAEKGEILWHWVFPKALVSALISSPVTMGNRVFLSGFQGATSWGACVELKAKGGKIEPRTVYIDNKLQCNGYHTVSIVDGAVYGFGRGTEWDALQCTDYATGKLLWQQEGAEWSRQNNMTVADGLIFALTKNNELVLAEANKTGYKELGRVKPGLKLGIQQQPTIYNGRLYLRGEDGIVCYQVGTDSAK